MLKGELKKAAILEAAEQLFCSNGFEKTAVQDIIDQLHTSKGSFYHHFESKEEVLQVLCESKAVLAAEETAKKLEDCTDDLAGINMIFRDFIPMAGDSLKFFLILLPVIKTQTGKTVLYCYQDKLKECFAPLLDEVLQKASKAQLIFPAYQKDIGEMCLELVNEFWRKTVFYICNCHLTGKKPDSLDLMQKNQIVENTIQRILESPYGSVRIFEQQNLLDFIDTIMHNL